MHEFGSISEESGAISTSRRSVSGIRFRWQSNYDFCLFVMVCSIETHGFTIAAKHPANADGGNIALFIIAYATFGLPLMYMMIIIGQYTQTGVNFFKNMIPIGHGLTYTYILLLFLRSVDRGTLISIYLVYLLTSIRKNLEWLQCSKHYKHCWTKKTNCTENCLVGRNISAFIYYFDKFLEKPEMDISKMAFTMPSFLKLFPLAIGWSIIIVCLVFSSANYKKFMKVVMIIAMVLLLILLSGALLTSGGLYYFEEVSKLEVQTWFTFSGWAISVDAAISLLALGRPFHVVAGSFLPPNAQSGILVVVVVTLNFIIIFIMNVITFSCYGIIKEQSFSSNEVIKKLPYDRSFQLMGIIPQALSFMGVEQFWTIVYIVFCLLIESNNQILHLTTLERCMCDSYPKLMKYKRYVVSFLCAFSFLIGVIFSSRTMYIFYKIFVIAAYTAASINCVMMAIFISWFYGIQKLCDDIHYLSGSQPSKYWVLSWHVTPLVLIITIVMKLKWYANTRLPTFTHVWFYCGLCLLFTSPIPICSILEMFKYIKRRNLLGVFKPTELHGPPDPEERRLRHIYNPRREIKSRRRADICHHRCLLTNRKLRSILREQRSHTSIISVKPAASLSLN